MDADHKRSADRMPAPPPVREAHDAEHEKALTRDSGHKQAKLEIRLDEGFPSSDAPAAVQSGEGESAPSSRYDEKAERKRDRR